MRVAVVTASIGERRKLLTPDVVNPSVDYVAFVDRELNHPVWRTVRVDRWSADPVRDSKLYKVFPERFVEDADASIWIDRHCRLLCDPAKVFGEFKEDVGLVHHYRACIFREGRACRDAHKDDRNLINQTVERFRLEGWPDAAGLYYGGFLLKRHSEAADRFSRLWWNYIETGSRRDQLSLPVAVRRSRVSAHIFHRRRRPEFFHIRGK